MTLLSVLLIRIWLQKDIMLNVYSVMKAAAREFMFISFPFMLLFCIALSVSNIQMIRKEGFKPENAPGIILSFLMLFGILTEFLVSDSFSSGSERQIKLFEAFTSIYSSVYAFLECFLIAIRFVG